MTCNVTGTAISPSGQIKPGAKITFRRAQLDVVSQVGSFVIPDDYIIQTALNGTVNFNILPGVYDATTVAVGGHTVAFRVSVPNEPAADFADILGSAYVEIPPASVTQAQQARDAAIAARDAAQASAVSAQASAVSAETARDAAESAADAAAESAADAAALYDGPWVESMTALSADTTLTYIAGGPFSVAAGDYVRTRAEGLCFQVASAGASDHHLATAGGVKLYEAGTSYTTRQRFAQAIARGELSGMINGTPVTAGGLEFARASGATAISDMPGWLPQGLPDYRHYATVAEFNAATGNAYPSPYMTRYDLPPTEIDIMASGVVPSNDAAHAANNVGAIQDMIDWLTSKANGGSIVGNGYSSAYSNPIITISQPIVLKPKVSFLFDERLRFRATSAMTTMIDSLSGSSNRLRRQSIRGGVWDANRLADAIITLRDFQQIYISRAELANCNGKSLYLSHLGQSAGNYELFVDHVLINRGGNTNNTGSVGIYSDSLGGFGDSHFSDIVAIGCENGVLGQFWNSSFSRVHPWSFPDTDGEMISAFDIEGGACSLIACYADDAKDFGYRFSGKGFSLIGSRTLRNRFTDNTGSCVGLKTSETSLVATGNIFRSSSATNRWANDFSGFYGGLVASKNTTINVVTALGDYDPSYSGKYTPSISGATNCSAGSVFEASWHRTGKVVTVSGVIGITQPSGGQFSLKLSLPVAANITANSELAGTCHTSTAVTLGQGGIIGSVADDTALITGTRSGSATDVYWSYHFTYRIP